MNAKSKETMVEEFRIQTIQEAAMRVIARRGIAAASMQEIADEAGIAKGTIYLYFENQQDLLEKTVDDVFLRLFRRLEAALDNESGKFRQRLTAIVKTQIEFFDAHQDFLRLYLAVKYPEGSPSRCARSDRPQYRLFQQKLTAFFGKAIESGTVRPHDPSRLALFLEEGVIAVLMQRLNENDSPPPDEDVEWIVSLMLEGVSSRTPRAQT